MLISDADYYAIKMPTVAFAFPARDRGYVSVCDSRIPVTADSPIRHLKALETVARAFTRELSYPRFCMANDGMPKDSKAYMFVSDRGWRHKFQTVCGAAFFENVLDRWRLNWVYVHPYERNKGLLTKHWEALEQEFGAFFIDGPYSTAMTGFMDARKIPDMRRDKRFQEREKTYVS